MALVPMIAVFWVLWLVRVGTNASLLDGTVRGLSPLWLVSSYFVPIVSFLIPVQQMLKIWQSSCVGLGDGANLEAQFLRFWWFLWLLFSTVGLFALAFAAGEWQVSDLGPFVALVVYALPAFICSIAALGVVRRLSAVQAARCRS